MAVTARPALVDSSAWIALQNPRDPAHEAVSVRFKRELSDRGRLLTTNHVLGETWTFLRIQGSHQKAVEFLEVLAATSRVETVFTPEPLEREAIAWLKEHQERPYSFVDAVSFAWMKRLGVDAALTLDSDFAVAGFSVLS